MASKIFTTTLLGIEAVRVDVEAQICTGKRRFSIVGLPDGILREARERVRCAIEECGFQFPAADVVVSLSPASLPKSGASFDLAVALSVLAAAGYIRKQRLPTSLFCGELSLSGEVRPASGVLASACLAAEHRLALVAHPLALTATRSVGRLERVPATSLGQVVRWLNGKESEACQEEFFEDEYSDQAPGVTTSGDDQPDFRDVIGQALAKRAVVIAAAGRHNLFMLGPPGSGKSMIAKRIPSILPPLTNEEAIELAKIRGASPSGSGFELEAHSRSRGGEDESEISDRGPGKSGDALRRLQFADSLIHRPPFRAPHHSISCAGLVGGGAYPVPGELSLAHRGILFLDELLEFRRDTLEALRQPLEDRTVLIRRVHFCVEFPSDVMLVAAANPCPCGGGGGGGIGNAARCCCTSASLLRYRQRLSGPMLDRVDLQVWVPPISVRELHTQSEAVDPTAQMRQSVETARKMQLDRINRGRQSGLNYSLTGSELREVCRISGSAHKLLENAVRRMHLSARSHGRILKVARSIADLAGSEDVAAEHFAEAISFRLSDWVAASDLGHASNNVATLS